MIGLLITIVLFPLVGWSVARRGWGETFLFGVGLTGAILFLAGVVHVPLAIALAGIVLTAGVRLFAMWRSPHRRQRTANNPLATIALASPLLVLAFVSAVVPLNDFDGRAFWVLKAKAIAHERSIDGPFFHGATRPRNHYPILIPLDGAVILSLSRDLDDRQLRWLYVGLLATLALLFSLPVHALNDAPEIDVQIFLTYTDGTIEELNKMLKLKAKSFFKTPVFYTFFVKLN